MWGMVERTTIYRKCSDARRGISKYHGVEQGVAQGFTASPTLFRVCIDNRAIAVRAAKREAEEGVCVVVSGLTSEDDLVKVS